MDRRKRIRDITHPIRLRACSEDPGRLFVGTHVARLRYWHTLDYFTNSGRIFRKSPYYHPDTPDWMVEESLTNFLMETGDILAEYGHHLHSDDPREQDFARFVLNQHRMTLETP